MAFETFSPKDQPLDGSAAFYEGYTWRGTYTVKKAVSGVDTPVNMTEYNGVAPTILFKTAAGGTTVGCPVGVCAWTSAVGGEFQVDITQAQTNPSGQVFSGRYEIFVLHNTEFDDPPGNTIKKRAMVFSGAWTIVPTVAAT